MSFVSLTLILFLMMDPLGNIPRFVERISCIDASRRTKVLFRELCIALGIMFIFHFLGEWIIYQLNVRADAVSFTAGLLLFVFSLKMLFPHLGTQNYPELEGEPFVVPLAIPMIARPALLATIMLLAHIDPGHIRLLQAITVAWVGAFIILIYCEQLAAFLGKNLLNAFEKLMGMILMLLAIQRLFEGVTQYLSHLN